MQDQQVKSKTRQGLSAYQPLIIRYRDGQLRRETILAPDRATALKIAEKYYGKVVGR